MVLFQQIPIKLPDLSKYKEICGLTLVKGRVVQTPPQTQTETNKIRISQHERGLLSDIIQWYMFSLLHHHCVGLNDNQ